MRTSRIALILLLQSPFIQAEAFYEPKKIESEASNYRILAIECITDKKLTKKETFKIESCINFKNFVKSKYPILKSSLESAQERAKIQAKSEGIESRQLREVLVLLMSARSHMKIAGELSAQI